mmetsp:Transcript_17085/g.52468  ORF Transcript_17085/g.52468 Transcript_17085/m.52468 type:complete len:102 (+) Transcript_17085:3685-3990(+)
MSDFVRGPVAEDVDMHYDLYAVSEHSGGLGGGHYTAVARNMDGLEDPTGEWFVFNDAGVSRADPDRIVTPRAYVLFYKRRGADRRWGGIVPAEADLATPRN